MHIGYCYCCCCSPTDWLTDWFRFSARRRLLGVFMCVFPSVRAVFRLPFQMLFVHSFTSHTLYVYRWFDFGGILCARMSYRIVPIHLTTSINTTLYACVCVCMGVKNRNTNSISLPNPAYKQMQSGKKDSEGHTHTKPQNKAKRNKTKSPFRCVYMYV